MPTQTCPDEPPTGCRIYAGGQPWVLVAVFHCETKIDEFLAKHRAVHPRCPLRKQYFIDTLGTDDWSILD